MRMMLLAALVLAPAGFAQRNPIGNNGSILHPGIPLTGAPASGFSRSGGGRPSGGRRSSGGGVVFVPYGVYGGSDYGFDGFYPGGYPSVHNPPPGMYDPIFGGYNPGPAYANPYQQQPVGAAPTVIINQNFQTDTVRPQFRDYSNAPLPEPGAAQNPPAASSAPVAPLADDQPTIFLIAMQDHTILPVIAYWVQGDTLNYISLKGVANKVSVNTVDRDLSKQLNAERNLPFALPAAR